MLYQLHFERLVEYDPGNQGISLQITLKLGKTSVEVPVKIDTGAGGSIFSRQYGEQPGLVIENEYQQTFSTATGTFLTFGHFVTLNIAGIEFDTLVYFAADEHFNRNVIGRFGGLDHFVIGVVDYEGKLYLRAYNE